MKKGLRPKIKSGITSFTFSECPDEEGIKTRYFADSVENLFSECPDEEGIKTESAGAVLLDRVFGVP